MVVVTSVEYFHVFVNISEATLVDDFYDDDPNSFNPIDEIVLGPNGRVQMLEATIRKWHLRPRDKPRRKITTRVRRFVRSLGQVINLNNSGTREADEVGHIIGDCLGGPNDRTYNFFPQSPNCNMEYYHKVERAIYDFIDASKIDVVSVSLTVEFVYVDYVAGVSPNRPRSIKVTIQWGHYKTEFFELSNM